jgi:hypothetical protein
MFDPGLFRKYLNLLTEETSFLSKSFDSTADSAAAKLDFKPVSPADTTVKPEVKPVASTDTTVAKEKPKMPGGYKGSGILINNTLVTNPEAYHQRDSAEGKKAVEKIDKKYGKEHWSMAVPVELHRQSGIHREKGSMLDAPWHYEGGGTNVQLPNGTYLSGWHKGFHDEKAPADILKMPPVDQISSTQSIGKVGAAADFLIKSGHDDDSVFRSLKYYFPDAEDKSLKTWIYSARDSARPGYSLGVSYDVDSPHDHKKNVLGPVVHPGALPQIDPDVESTMVARLMDLGQSKKIATSTIRSAFRTKSGANVAHSYMEIDPKLLEKGFYAYQMPGQYQVGDFTVVHFPETDDDGKPTGRNTVAAYRVGQYKKGNQKRVNDVSSYWHGTKEQWERDKKLFYNELKKVKSYDQPN